MAVISLIIFFLIINKAEDEGRGLARALIEELSSWVSIAVALPIAGSVALWLHRGNRRLWRVVLVQAVAFTGFFVVHVGGFLLLRKAVFGLLGGGYHVEVVGEMLHEAAKEIPAYVLSVVGFWGTLRWLPPARPAAHAPDSFDIRDGARLVRAPLADIVAIRSAGNYAEFLLADGRTPLMRSSLSRLEEVMVPGGFVRTHRSWLVNKARVTGLRPDGSGDYTIELGVLEAPLSRRFRQALTALRA